MSTNVITVEAKLTGDSANMVAALKQATSALNATKSASNEVGFNAMTALRSGISNTVGFVVKLGVAAAATGSAMAIAFAGSAVHAGIARLSEIQDVTDSLTHTLGSASAAATLVQQTLQVVAGTPLDFQAFAEADKQLIGFGVDIKQIPDLLKAISDAAAVGGGTESVSALTTAFGRMDVQGKVTSRTLLTMGTNGVQAQKILADAFGVTTGELAKMISKGLVPAAQAQQILINGIENGAEGVAGSVKALGGSAQDLAKTMSGALGVTKIAFAQMGATWLAPLQKAIPKILNSGIVPLLNTLAIAGAKVTTAFADSGNLQKVIDVFVDLKNKVGPDVDILIQLANTLSPLQIIFAAIKDVWPEVSQAFADTGKDIVTTLIPSLSNLFASMTPILPVIAKLVQAFAQGLNVDIPVFTGIIKGLTPVLTLFSNIVKSLPTPLLGVVTALSLMNQVGVPVFSILSSIGKSMLEVAGLAGAEGAKDLGTFSGALGAIKTAAGENGALGALQGVKTFLAGPWGLAILGATAALGILALVTFPQAAQASDSVTASLDKQTASLTKLSKTVIAGDLQKSGATGRLIQAGVNPALGVAAASGSSDAMKALQSQLQQAESGLNAIQKKAGGSPTTSQTLSEKAAQQRINDISTAIDLINKENGVVGASILQQKQLNQSLGLTSTARAAENKATNDSIKAIKSLGGSLDKTDPKYTAAKTALDNTGKALKAYDQSVQATTNSSAKQKTAIDGSVETLLKQAGELGITGLAADKYVGKLLGIPTYKVTEIQVEDEQAQAAIDSYLKKLKALPANISQALHLSFDGNLTFSDAKAAMGGMWNASHQYMAAGGFSGARQSMIAPGGANITWAEKSTGWESYISGDPAFKQRSVDIWKKTGKRLGVQPEGGGGMTYAPQHTWQVQNTNPAEVAKFVKQQDAAVYATMGGHS